MPPPGGRRPAPEHARCRHASRLAHQRPLVSPTTGPLPELYNLSRWQEDNSAKKREAAVPPHVYAIARRAYSQLREKVGMAEAERAAAAASGGPASPRSLRQPSP